MLLRICAYGFKKYFTSIPDINSISVLGSLILYIFAICIVYIIGKNIKMDRNNKIQRTTHHLQGSNLIGYRDDKYDLDNAYITDQLDEFNYDSLKNIKSILDDTIHGHQHSANIETKLNDRPSDNLLAASSNNVCVV